jgi:GAF domain-containing protein
MKFPQFSILKGLSARIDLASEEERRAQAIKISLVTAVLMGLTSLGTFIYFQVSGEQPTGMAVQLGVTLLALFSAWLAYRHQARLGIWLLVAGQIILPIIFIGQVIPGQSATISLTTLIMIGGIVGGTLPGVEAGLAILLTILQSLYFLGYDYFGTHQYVERNYAVSFAIILVDILVYAYFNRHLLARSSLRARFTIAFLVVALLPLVTLATMNTQQLTDLQNETARKELASLNNTTVASLDAFVQDTLDATRTEARLPSLVNYVQNPQTDPSEAQAVLRSLALRDPVFIVSYGLLDKSGKNLLDTNPSKVGIDEADRQYFQVSLASGRPYVSNVMFYDGLARLFFAAPLRDPQGETIGVLRVEYNGAILQWLVANEARVTQGVYVVLLDDDNYLRLAHSLKTELLYQTYTSLTEEQAANLQRLYRLPPGKASDLSKGQDDVIAGLRNLAEQPFFTSFGVAVNESTVSTATHLRIAPWLVLTRMPVSLIQSAVTAQTRSSVVLALLIAVLVTAFAAVLVQVLTRPIVALTQTAQQVAAGDLDAKAPESQLDEIGALGRTFNQMTQQLKETLGGLEQRVADRTRALELSSDVSRRLSTILNTQQLVGEVVELLQFAFNYYHVHIYLWDDAKENLLMVGGTGEVGKIMLGNKHSIPRGRGLVGQASDTGAVVLVQDTRSDPNWLPNPLLPETRSEIAVPILLGDEVLGALDVQQNVSFGLTQQDADVLRGIASQVAIALRNARQYDQAQAHALRDTRLNEMIDQIERTQSVQEALQVAARELGRELQVPRIQTRLHIGENGDKVQALDQERQV